MLESVSDTDDVDIYQWNMVKTFWEGKETFGKVPKKFQFILGD